MWNERPIPPPPPIDSRYIKTRSSRTRLLLKSAQQEETDLLPFSPTDLRVPLYVRVVVVGKINLGTCYWRAIGTKVKPILSNLHYNEKIFRESLTCKCTNE